MVPHFSTPPQQWSPSISKEQSLKLEEVCLKLKIISNFIDISYMYLLK